MLRWGTKGVSFQHLPIPRMNPGVIHRLLISEYEIVADFNNHNHLLSNSPKLCLIPILPECNVGMALDTKLQHKKATNSTKNENNCCIFVNINKIT